MKILAIIGSYRKKGNTSQIIKLIETRMQELATTQGAPLEFETLFLGHQNIGVCRGCRVCFDQGETKCPLKDNLLEIRAKMTAASGILVASPVYVNDVNGIIKNWIDRLAFICHRPEFAGKSAYLIATVGVGPTGHALKTLSTALNTWGFSISGQASFKMGALMNKNETETLFTKQVEKIAKKFYFSIQTQSANTPSFVSLMTFRIQQGYWWRDPLPGSVDYEYWVNQGWTQPKRDYYIPHRSKRLKVHLARFVGALLTPFVT